MLLGPGGTGSGELKLGTLDRKLFGPGELATVPVQPEHSKPGQLERCGREQKQGFPGAGSQGSWSL